VAQSFVSVLYTSVAAVRAQYPNAFGTVTDAQLTQFIVARSAHADTKMSARYAMPPQQPYDPSLVQCVIDLVAWDAVQARGYNPQSGSDRNFMLRAIGADGHGGAMRLLDDVQRQAAHFNLIEAVQPSPAYPAPLVVSSPLQGWGPSDVVPTGFRRGGVW
jgi:hypothetical protein